MKPEHFERVVQAFQKTAPFRPFAVELKSGTRIEVDHPEALIFRGGVAVYLSANGTPAMFDYDGVAQVTAQERNGRHRRRRLEE